MTRYRRLTALLGAAMIATPLLTACTPPTPTGTLTGQLRMLVGVIAPPNHGAVPGTVVAIGAGQRRYVSHASADGHYTLIIPAGSYILTGRTTTFNGGRQPCALGSATVAGGKTTSRDLVCNGP